MDAAAEAATLRRQLEKAVSSKDVERMSDVLRSLGNVSVTLEVLQESKVGATVSKLKKHADGGVSDSAKALIKKWKKVAEASGVQSAPAAAGGAGAAGKGGKSASGSPGGKGPGPLIQTVGHLSGRSGGGSDGGAGSGAGSGSGTNNEAATAEETTTTLQNPAGKEVKTASATSSASPLSRQSSASSTSELSASLEVDSVLAEDGLASLRLKMRKKLLDTLLSGSSEDERLPTAHVAKMIECAMDENSPYLSKKDSYLDKARQLVFNLKKNDQLRQDTREGLVTPQRLVLMTSTELMSKEKREAMNKAVNDRTEARMLDWYDKNQDKINKQCGITQTEGMFECGRCKSTKTTYTQKQTRSADEPMTTFVTCTNCKNRWKFC